MAKRIELEKRTGSEVKHFDITSITPTNNRESSAGTNIVFQLGNLEVHAFKSASKQRARYVPSAVKKDGEFVWEFSDEKEDGIPKIAFLLTHSDSFHLIGVVSGKNVLRAVPLDDLEKCQVIKTTKGRQIIGGRDSLKLFHLKRQIAESLDFLCTPTLTESKLMQLRREKLGQGTSSEAKQKAAERERRRQEILKRSKIMVYREDSRKIVGLPVTQSEWQCLPHKTGVVLVSSYEDGKAGEPEEAFFVDKSKSNPAKFRACKVTKQSPLSKSDDKGAAVPIEMDMQLFQFGDEIVEAFLVDKDAIEQLRQQGINSGSRFAVKYKEGDPTVLVELTGKEVNTIGNLVPVS